MLSSINMDSRPYMLPWTWIFRNICKAHHGLLSNVECQVYIFMLYKRRFLENFFQSMISSMLTSKSMMSSIAPKCIRKVTFGICNFFVKGAEVSYTTVKANETSHSNVEGCGTSNTYVKASVIIHYIVVTSEASFYTVDVNYSKAVSSEARHSTVEPFDNSCCGQLNY